jgi:hypothetical protein
MRLTLLTLALVLAVLSGPAVAQTTAPPDPLVLLAPKDDFERALPGEITFRVEGMPNEAPGSLGIELKTEDANPAEPNVDEGRYDEEDPYWAGRYELKETQAGSGIYEVTVDFDGPSLGYYWHAYRVLTPGQNCTPKTNGGYDCFQETKERTFYVADPEEHGAHEPKNNTPAGATFNEGLTTDGWLESRKDRDWYRFRSGKGTRLNVLIGNYFAGPVPAGENADIVFAVYRADRLGKPIVKRRLAPGQTNRYLRARIKARRRYKLVVRHANSDAPRARDISYSFYIEKGVAG